MITFVWYVTAAVAEIAGCFASWGRLPDQQDRARGGGDVRDFALALACFVLLMGWKAPPWVVVVVTAVGGVGLALIA
jgi:drug/metabolite transporter superfamily protein YnfA